MSESKPDNTGKKQDTKFKKGVSGNPKGRPKGVRNVFGEKFVNDFTKAWESYGEAALLEMAASRPYDFVKVAAQILPKDVQVSGSDGGPISITWQK